MEIAIIGTSKITERFLDAASRVEGIKPAAVYSRKQETGDAYAKKHGLEKVFTDLSSVAEDKEIDAVYIASPNCCHADQAIAMLQAGKHVLCEKPIASNAEEVNAMYEAADWENVVLLEAVRNIYDPGFCKIEELLCKIGAIRHVHLSFCQYSSRYDNFKNGIIENAFNPALSNAALMDIGVYGIHPLIRLFGKPQEISSQSVFLSNGMEGAGNVLFQYPCMLAQIEYSKITQGAIPSQIQGEDGVMLLDAVSDTRKIELIFRDGSREVHHIEKDENNMVYEIKKFVDLVENGIVDHSYRYSSIEEMEVMDIIRRKSGIKFK